MKIIFDEMAIDEQQAVKDHLTRAVGSYVYMTARDKVEHVFKELKILAMDEDEKFTVSFDVQFSVGTLISVIGNHRRAKKNVGHFS